MESPNNIYTGGDISVYASLNLPPGFWTQCWKCNSMSPLMTFITVTTHDFSLPVREMKALARTCKWFFGAIQCTLMKYKQLRLKWEPIIAKKLKPYLIYRQHPFTYTGVCSKAIAINDDMVASHHYGLCPLDDVHQQRFTDIELAGTRYSLVDVGFYTRTPVPLRVFLHVADVPVFSIVVHESDYIDRGILTPRVMAAYTAQYGHDIVNWPGRYYVKLRAPTMFNPIPLGPPFVSMNRVYISVTPLDVPFECVVPPPDFAFILAHITTVIMHLRTVDMAAYPWNDYGVLFAGYINAYIHSCPLTLHLSGVIQ